MAPLFLDPSPNELIARQAARELGVSRDRVLRWVYVGILPAVRVGRVYSIRRTDLAALRASRPDLVYPAA